LSTKGRHWWLAKGAENWKPDNGVKYLLPFLCHRTSKDISTTCTTQAAGQPRTEQRAQTAANVAASRQAYRALEQNSLDEFQQQEKKMKFNIAKVHILSKKTDISSKQTDTISNQLALLEKMKDVIVATKGVEFYNKKVVALIEKLPSPVMDETEDAAGAPEEGGEGREDDDVSIPEDVREEMAQEMAQGPRRFAGMSDD